MCYGNCPYQNWTTGECSDPMKFSLRKNAHCYEPDEDEADQVDLEEDWDGDWDGEEDKDFDEYEEENCK